MLCAVVHLGLETCLGSSQVVSKPGRARSESRRANRKGSTRTKMSDGILQRRKDPRVKHLKLLGRSVDKCEDARFKARRHVWSSRPVLQASVEGVGGAIEL